jgi:hypothetical protein
MLRRVHQLLMLGSLPPRVRRRIERGEPTPQVTNDRSVPLAPRRSAPASADLQHHLAGGATFVE